jgi:signal transduction histidine kinase
VYWGQYAHAAPELVLVVGAIAVIASFALAWSNARYVALRIEGLATRAASRDQAKAANGLPALANHQDLAPDEIDEIERVVHRLSSEVQLAELNRADREKLFERRAHDYALLLASVADASAKRIEEVRLPLHILLENKFGDLNENQEEMLGAARAAAEAADADMLSLRQIAQLDLGERSMRQDRMKPSEIIEALRPMLMAAAESAGVTIEFDVAPLLPAIIGDRAMLQDALVTILRGAVAGASADSQVRIHVDRDGSLIRFVVHGDGTAPVSVRWAAAVRVIQAHAGSVSHESEKLRIELPAGSGS